MGAQSPIDIASDVLRVRVLPMGAALVGVRFADAPRNLVLGFDDPADQTRVPIYAGAVVGPVANRLRGGMFEHDGTRWQMPLNETGRTTLHSGPEGLHAQLWRVMAVGSDHVALTCTLPDGACGLPGSRHFVAEYRAEGPRLSITLRARTNAPSPINLAAHPYWNLDGQPDVSAHHLQVFANRYLPTDALNLPTGAPASVTGTQFDFTTATAVPLVPELDVNYCLADASRSAPQPAARLMGCDGTTLKIATNAPGIQIYNGAYLPDTAPQPVDFPSLQPYAGIALEPQHWPDAPHNPSFPGITLLPDDHYFQQTHYDLSRG